MSSNQTNTRPKWGEGDEFIDFTSEDVGTWVVERVEWEQRWKQGDGAWAYYLQQKNGDETRHKLESGIEWDIQHGRLDEAPSGEIETEKSQPECDGGYPTFSDVGPALRGRSTSAFTRSRGGVPRTNFR